MRTAPLAFVLALAAAPAFAQDHGSGHGHGGWGGRRDVHVEGHRARDAEEAADHYARRARRDAAVGDHHGAEHAWQRAQAAARDAWRHRDAARHGYGGRGYGDGATHDDRH